jgi:hypothetical protein
VAVLKYYDGDSWEPVASALQGPTGTTGATGPTGATGATGTSNGTFRNILINGGFAIDQRNSGSSQTFTAAAALAYSVDRWYGYCTGANITGARVAGAAPSQYYYRFTGATSNTAVGFGQRIEAANSFHFANRTAVLSVSLASTSITSVTWTAFYANTTDTFGTLASPTRTQIATGTFTINSTLSRYSAAISVPAAATTGIEIVFTTGALVGSQTLTFDDAQFELGSSPTDFEQRPIDTELAMCQRYFWRGFVAAGGVWGGSGGSVPLVSWPYPVRMRTAPIWVFISGGIASNGNVGYTVTGVVTSAIQVDSALLGFSISGSTGANTQGCAVYDSLNSFSAEL